LRNNSILKPIPITEANDPRTISMIYIIGLSLLQRETRTSYSYM